MIVEVVRLHLIWPDEVTVLQLRSWLISHIECHGKPLRWAITSVQPASSNGNPRSLILEAVITKEERMNTENSCD